MPRTHGSILAVLLVGTGLLACDTKKEAPDKSSPASAAAVATGPAVDPATFAEIDTAAWTVTNLPKARLSLRLPKGVQVTEDGTLSMAPVGPYVGLLLASGYDDVQIDTTDAG
ncbi:hypothetical protein BH11MYX2_BH11MYX2_06660 [soil metagenome]